MVYLLIGRSPRVAVPFVELWQDPELPRPRRIRSLRPPPLAIGALLAGLLLSIIAAARPVVLRASAGPPITVILDRGGTMSGKAVLEEIEQALLDRFGKGPVEFWQVPGAIAPLDTDRSHWRGIANSLPPTALDTSDLLAGTIASAMRRDDRPIVVISNQRIDRMDARLVQIPPSRMPPQNVGFVRVAARTSPTGAAMVSVRNDSDQRSARLRVRSGATAFEQELSLPPRGQQADVFIDLPGKSDEILSFELVVADDLAVDNRAWLVRQHLSAKVQSDSTVPAEVRRMAEVYARHRPPSPSAKEVFVTTQSQEIAATTCAAIVVSGDQTAGAFRAMDHPITREVRDWPEDATLAPPPGEGWQPIVTANGRPCVAVRQSPARQVWIGFDSATFARRPDFVVFWTNVFDWLAGEDEYTSEPVRPLSSEWQRDDAVCGPRLTADPTTGVFRSAAGGLVALNALDLDRRMVPAAGDWYPISQCLPIHSQALS